MTTTASHDLIPTVYKAIPIRQGTYDETGTTWVATCPVPGCHYGPQLDDLQVLVDAVAGHVARVHPDPSYRDPDRGLPPMALLTMALEEFATGRPGEALGMIREARDRMQTWVVE